MGDRPYEMTVPKVVGIEEWGRILPWAWQGMRAQAEIHNGSRRDREAQFRKRVKEVADLGRLCAAWLADGPGRTAMAQALSRWLVLQVDARARSSPGLPRPHAVCKDVSGRMAGISAHHLASCRHARPRNVADPARAGA